MRPGDREPPKPKNVQRRVPRGEPGGAIRRRQITAPRRSRPRGEDAARRRARALAGVNAAARAAHVSYGQYVAILKDAAARHLPPQEVEAKLRGAARW